MAKAAQIVTKDSLQRMLTDAEDPKRAQIIGRALVVLFERQTASEKAAATTDENNNIGFAGCDAKSGTLTAKYFLKHKTLADWQIEKWMKLSSSGYFRICKYAKQLNEAAIIKAAKAEQQQLPL